MMDVHFGFGGVYGNPESRSPVRMGPIAGGGGAPREAHRLTRTGRDRQVGFPTTMVELHCNVSAAAAVRGSPAELLVFARLAGSRFIHLMVSDPLCGDPRALPSDGHGHAGRRHRGAAPVPRARGRRLPDFDDRCRHGRRLPGRHHGRGTARARRPRNRHLRRPGRRNGDGRRHDVSDRRRVPCAARVG